MMALMPIWISIPEKYNPFYFFALPTGAVFFFAALELLKGRVEITFSDSDMKITYLKNDRFYKRKDTHIEINEIKEIEFYNYKGYDIMTIILKDKEKIRLKRHSFVFDDYEKLKYYINSLQNFSSFEM